MHSSSSSNSSSSSFLSISFFFTLFALISVLLVLPLGFFLSGKARVSVTTINEKHIDNLRTKQQEILQMIMTAQKTLSKMEARIDNELNALKFVVSIGSEAKKEDLTIEQEQEEESSPSSKWKRLISDSKKQKIQNLKSIESLTEDYTARLGALKKETKVSFDQQRDREKEQEGDENSNNNKNSAGGIDPNKRYCVKWHAGTEGVLTSDRFRTLQEATIKYDAVGDVAKKLLTLPISADGNPSRRGNWMIVRQNGGDNWLSCMSNDAEPQPGACKAE